jgi:putative endonuclease
MSDEADVEHWMVYMLECADKTLYTGITNDLDRRLAEHAAGKGAKYTKDRGPRRLVYRETCQGRAAASRRETAIKFLSRAEKLRLCSCNKELAIEPGRRPYVECATLLRCPQLLG